MTRPRSRIISVRVTPAEGDAIAKAAKSVDMLPSQYLREVALLGDPAAFMVAVNQRMQVRSLEAKIEQIREIIR